MDKPPFQRLDKEDEEKEPLRGIVVDILPENRFHFHKILNYFLLILFHSSSFLSSPPLPHHPLHGPLLFGVQIDDQNHVWNEAIYDFQFQRVIVLYSCSFIKVQSSPSTESTPRELGQQ